MVSTETSYFYKLHQILEKKKIKLLRAVVFDMDGTLLSPDQKLSKRTIASLQMIVRKGALVLLATVRTAGSVEKHFEKLGRPDLIIAHNGALVKDIKNGQILHHQVISKDVVTQLLELLEGKETVIHFYCDDEIYVTTPNHYSERYSQEVQVPLKHIFSFQQMEKVATSIQVIDRKDAPEQLLMTLSILFREKVDFVLIPWQNYIWRTQFLPLHTSKGKSVLRFAKYLGVQPKEIISFSDNYNDIEMIQYTGLGIAMSNAIPKLKEVADFVTLSNREDGVAQALEVLFKP